MMLQLSRQCCRFQTTALVGGGVHPSWPELRFTGSARSFQPKARAPLGSQWINGDVRRFLAERGSEASRGLQSTEPSAPAFRRGATAEPQLRTAFKERTRTVRALGLTLKIGAAVWATPEA